MSAKQGIVNIRGKEYETVALRVHKFRESCPTFSLVTEIIHRDTECVVMRATIKNEAGTVVATGHAEEYRKASEINRTSALENCETSAIGRALAAFGLGGMEFASADEVARAITGKKGPVNTDGIKILPTDGAGESLSDEVKAELEEVALLMVDYAAEGKELAAARLYYERKDNDEKVYLWKLLAGNSGLRKFIKDHQPKEPE